MMSAHFNLSKDYIGSYFKRNTGVSLKDCIKGYRRSLIRKRMEVVDSVKSKSH